MHVCMPTCTKATFVVCVCMCVYVCVWVSGWNEATYRDFYHGKAETVLTTGERCFVDISRIPFWWKEKWGEMRGRGRERREGGEMGGKGGVNGIMNSYRYFLWVLNCVAVQ